jgi:plasmid stability protein
MATITVRALDEETKNRLRLRAARNGHSMEQEVRDILCAALSPTIHDDAHEGENWVDHLRRIIKESDGDFHDLELAPRPHQDMRNPFEGPFFKEWLFSIPM